MAGKVEINIHKDWKNPQEMIFQKLVFDELKEINKEKDITSHLEKRKYNAGVSFLKEFAAHKTQTLETQLTISFNAV